MFGICTWWVTSLITLAVDICWWISSICFQWQAAIDCSSAAERQQLCERVFQSGEEELGLLEALKLLMLGRAVELHGCMQSGGDVPLFCWLLFARDSSDCPRSFLSNHLSHVGLSAGLEQVGDIRPSFFICWPADCRFTWAGILRRVLNVLLALLAGRERLDEPFYGKRHKESSCSFESSNKFLLSKLL